MIEPRFRAVNYAENLLRNSSQESMHPSGKLLSHNRVGMPKVSQTTCIGSIVGTKVTQSFIY